MAAFYKIIQCKKFTKIHSVFYPGNGRNKIRTGGRNGPEWVAG